MNEYGKRETVCVQCAGTIYTRLAGYRSLCSVECESMWASTHILNGRAVYGDPRVCWIRVLDPGLGGIVHQARRCWRPDDDGRLVPEGHVVKCNAMTCGMRFLCDGVDTKCKNPANFGHRGTNLCTMCYVRFRASGDEKYDDQWAADTRPYDEDTGACTSFYQDTKGAEFALDFRELHLALLSQASPEVLHNISPTVHEAIMADYADWTSCRAPSKDARFST